MKTVQSTLGFATMDKAANLDLAAARALTDLRQYINSDLVFSDLKFRPLYNKIATVKVVIPSGPTPYPANIAFSDHLVAKTQCTLYFMTFLGRGV